MRRATILAVALLLMLSVAAPAFALTGADGVGREYGQHVSGHVRDMEPFTGEHNPGVVHHGFSEWPGHE